jgi:N-acetylglucosaminyldiphosphoundecaprenol N-acetyl-beta-D-mannosaminyltransferase
VTKDNDSIKDLEERSSGHISGLKSVVKRALFKLSATPEKGYISKVKSGTISLRDIRNASKIGHQGQHHLQFSVCWILTTKTLPWLRLWLSLKQTLLKKKRALSFANPDCMNKMITDREYFRILKEGNDIFPYGI